MKPIPAVHPAGDSPFPWHHFPNEAPKGYHLVDGDCRPMEGDLSYHMDDGCWHPVARKDIGRKGQSYIRLVRLNRNSLLARAQRSRLKWQPMKTANTHCVPLILKAEGLVTMGRCLSIGPTYTRQGWFMEPPEDDPYGKGKRIHPTAWAPPPES